MRIDVHSHYFPPSYLERAGEEPTITLPDWQFAASAGSSLSERLDVMDAAGVTVQTLSASLAQPYASSSTRGAALAREINDALISVSNDTGGRLRALASLPLPHMDESISELERVWSEDAVVGLSMGTSILGTRLDAPILEPLYRELNDRAGVVVLHPVMRDCLVGDDLWIDRVVGGVVEDSLAALQLVRSGVLDRYPDIEFVVPHLGGVLPFLAGRLGQETMSGLRRLWYDTASAHPPAYRCAGDTLPKDRFLFGTDYPYLSGTEYVQRVENVNELGLNTDELASALGGASARLLGLDSQNPIS